MALDSQSASNNQSFINGNSQLYDPKALKNYAAMSAMCWPGFDNSYMQTALVTAKNDHLHTNGSNSQSFVNYPTVHSTTNSTFSAKKKAQPVLPEHKDQTYWERRRRNNESARRSRESRRQKEEQISFRVVYLEQENMQLRTEVGMLRGEIEKLRNLMVYSTAQHAVVNAAIQH